MKIDDIKINAFGKLKNVEFKFKNSINIIFGRNEAGKSTLIKFILNSLYGISKNKKGKEYSDFDKYLPWNGEDFSGKIVYTLDNGQKFEVFRDFKKKNPKIFNDKMEDISGEFNIDKSLGNQFFYDQTNVDEELFLSTYVSNQNEVKLQQNEQSMLIQKIANLVGTGDDNTSFKLAMSRIHKRQLEEVGTDKSREKPINIIQRKINELEIERKNLEKYENIKYEIEEKTKEENDNIFDLNNELGKYYKIKEIKEKEKIEIEKINMQENLKNINFDKIKDIENKIEEIKKDNVLLFDRVSSYENSNDLTKNKKNVVLYIFIFLIFIFNIFQLIFVKNRILNFVFLSIFVVFMILSSLKVINDKKKKKLKKIKREEDIKNSEIIKEKISLLDNEIDTILNNNKEIDEIINEIKKEISKNEYKELSIENVQFKIKKIQEQINDSKIKLHTLEFDKNNIEPQIERFSKIEEEYIMCLERKEELENLNLSMNLAQNILTDCYEIMKNSVTPKFTKNLSYNISEITNGKYENVQFNEEKGLIVENEYGEYISASRLSIGTIEELYLSLRLSMIDDLSDENMPVLLDESFAYFDDERLKNFLLFINKKYPNKQFFVFTCTNREKNILDSLNINYNNIDLTFG